MNITKSDRYVCSVKNLYFLIHKSWVSGSQPETETFYEFTRLKYLLWLFLGLMIKKKKRDFDDFHFMNDHVLHF